MNYYIAGIPYSDELYHFGIKGQKWGVRRYQNEDGSLTQAGKERYGTVENFKAQTQLKEAKKAERKAFRKAVTSTLLMRGGQDSENYRKIKAEREKKQEKADRTDFVWKKEKYKEEIARGKELAKNGFSEELAYYRLRDAEDDEREANESLDKYKEKMETGKATVADLFFSMSDEMGRQNAQKRQEDIWKDIEDYNKYMKYGRGYKNRNSR